MAEKPIEEIVSGLPEDWKNNDIISPDGTSVGLTEKHGYNYLMKAVNEVISGVNKINDYFEGIATTDDVSNLDDDKLDGQGGDASSVITKFSSPSTLQELVSGEKLGTSMGKLAKSVSTLKTHIENMKNPHGVTKAQVGLGNVDNTSDLDKPISIETQEALDEKASVDVVNAGYTVQKGKTYSGPASDYGIYVAEIEGAYEQDTTNGFQLFDASKLQTKTQGGATVTNNGDGSFTVSGSGNLTESFMLVHSYPHEETIKLLKSGTLNFVCESTSPSLRITIRKNGSDIFTLTSSSKQGQISQEDLNDETTFMFLTIYGLNGSAIKSGTFKPMLYQDGDGTWEQFTGGKPSPSPEYPQEPKFTKIRKFISSGRNLFNFEYLKNSNVASGTKTYTDNSITITSTGGDCFDQSYQNPLFRIPVIPNKDYSLLFKTSLTYTGYTYIFFYDKEKKSIGNKLLSTTELNTAFNFTIPENCYYISFRNGITGAGKTCTFSDFMILVGTHTWDDITQFIPYQGIIETPTYHNLFNISGELNQTKDGNQSGANLNTLEGNVLVVGANSSMVDCQGQKLVNDLTGKKISVGVNITSLGTGTKGKVMIYDNGELGYGFEQGLGYHSIDGYTCKSDNIVIAFGTVDGEKAKFEDIIVNIGEEAEEWVPYIPTDNPQGVLELRALPDGTKDTYNMTYEEMGMNLLPVAKVTFDGSDDEVWTYDSSVYKRVRITISDAYKVYGQRIMCLCNVGTSSNASNANNPYLCFIGQDGGFYFYLDEKMSSVEEWKAYLQSNPINVYYLLDTSKTEEYNLNMIPSFYDYTNVWTDSDVEPNMVEWHANTYAGRNQEIGNDLIRIEDVWAFKDAVSVGNTTTNRTVLKTVDDDGIYMYNESKGLQRLATIEELNKNIAGISLSFEAVISPGTGSEVNENFEVGYPDGFDSSNCMVIGISEMEPANGNRMISEHTTVQLGAKQMIQVNYQNTFSTSRTIEIDIILMKIPNNL